MPVFKSITGVNLRFLISGFFISLIVSLIASCNDHPDKNRGPVSTVRADSAEGSGVPEEYLPVYTILVLPKNPGPGEPFRVLATGGKNIRKAQIILTGITGSSESVKSKSGEELPYWRIDEFNGNSAGNYKITLIVGKKVVSNLEFEISPPKEIPRTGVVWKTLSGWDSNTEALYSAWISVLFYGCNEQASWPALNDVIRNKNQNFLYNYLSMGEDDPNGKISLIMQPDCADNPFFLRAYFAWKLSLPFGYHICDRGWVGRNPKTGQWITNESASTVVNQVQAFNAFLRRVMNDVHSGTARTGLDDESSDYYPVALERGDLRPGVVFADPYGHTLILIRWVEQTNGRPGLLLSVDAQPDGTVGVKRFWKGNFLFNTSGVVGEPGFKAFRPIGMNKGLPFLMQNKALTSSSGFAPFSLQQRRLKTDNFYRIMDRLINPKPLDPEAALLDLIEALHEQLIVRVTSVANGEAYLKLHPGAVVPMPSNANGIFLAGGQWENFSTPNRDLRLLIAIDAILDFPDLVARSPEDFNTSARNSPEQIKEELQSLLDKKVSGLSISYARTDGSLQNLTLAEILKRRDAFEMAYNPNDGIEIRWGAPENSEERATCHRHASSNQLETMRQVRVWFHKRLHPPT
jgi:hypothetical protein